MKKIFLFIVSIILLCLCGIIIFNRKVFDLQIEIKHGCPLIPVSIGGDSFFLLLDTGAWESSLEQEIIRLKNMPSTGHKKRFINIYGQCYERTFYSCNDIKIGKYFAKHHEFLTEIPANLEDEEIPEEILKLSSGNIGLRFFCDKAVVIDKKNAKCMISEDISYLFSLYKNLPGDWVELTLAIEEHCIVFYIKDHIHPYSVKKFILDTGTTHSLVHDDSLKIQSLTLSSKIRPISIPLELNDGVSLGYHPFIPVNLSPIGFDGILGFDFFDNFLVICDFVHKKIFIKKYNSD